MHFYYPFGIEFGKNGTIMYIMDTYNNAIRQVDMDTSVVSTLAGKGPNHHNLTDGLCINAAFSLPTAAAVDHLNNLLYITDSGNEVIRLLNITDCTVHTFAGSTAGHMNGIGTAAKFSFPSDIVIDTLAQVLYVCDYYGQVIRKVIIITREVTTIAGIYSVAGNVDGYG